MLLEIIKQRIKADGFITIHDFMSLALLHSDYGYYSHGDHFGVRGDFITAPEISQIFGELIGLWCLDCWQKLGEPQPFNIIELGPGRGTLMSDLMRATNIVPKFQEHLHIHLVDTNRAMRHVQEDLLQNWSVQWIKDLKEIKLNGPFILIANEFFDALPIRQFYRTLQGWLEQVIICDDDKLNFDFVESKDTNLIKIFYEDENFPIGSCVEVSPSSYEYLLYIKHLLNQYNGAALFIDYGYIKGYGNSLQAVSQHKYVDLLFNPGQVDLTAHVNFGAFTKIALEHNLQIYGPTTQGMWLNKLGLPIRAENILKKASLKEAEQIKIACYRLTDPSQMGSLFKVLALSRDYLLLEGFDKK
ncbi:MAG: SAM-dependent methyltransferase [Alphaproteobacteria bacterium]|nr:SAM-dependent methyltransferase [Alphaproteobacteria bacterium]